MKAITNCKFFLEDRLVKDKFILLENDKIKSITSTIPDHIEVMDASGNYVVAGFIDLQIYGASSRLFSAYPSAESLNIMEESLLKEGTTGFLACIATNTPEVFKQCIEAAKEHRSAAKNCMGLHLEGPFLNPKRRGAHIEAFVRKASLDEIKALLDFGDGVIKMMTIAPELQDDTVIQYLLDSGVILSLGHSDATFEQASRAYDLGIQSTTHLFNAMSPLHHRDPGIPTAVFNHNKAMSSIIPDGLHVDYEVVKIAKQLLKDRMFIITDAVTDCNIGPYQHRLRDGKYITEDGTLSGSALTMVQSVKNCIEHCDIEFNEALKMASLYPAKLIQQQNETGEIKEGYKANLLLLDEHLNLNQVIFNGKSIN